MDANPDNRRLPILETLEAANVTNVVILYDRQGDQFRINSIRALDGANTQVPLDQPTRPKPPCYTLGAAIQSFAQDLLAQQRSSLPHPPHRPGRITIDVITNKIRIRLHRESQQRQPFMAALHRDKDRGRER